MSKRAITRSGCIPKKCGCAERKDESECDPPRHLHGFTAHDLATLARKVTNTRRQQNKAEMEFYRNQDSFADALRAAALCETKCGTMHDHQRRIGKEQVHESYQVLRRSKLESCKTFEALEEKIHGAVHDMDRIGDLYTYDVAQRIGAYLGLKPEHVYLHAGTLRGARNLGLRPRRRFLHMDELPPSLQGIDAALLEDFFCMKKDCLRPSMLGDWQPPSVKRR